MLYIHIYISITHTNTHARAHARTHAHVIYKYNIFYKITLNIAKSF